MTDTDLSGDGALAWPGEWRRTSRRQRSYQEKGTASVRTVAVEIDGWREPGLLLPMSATPRWQAALFALAGAVFLALAAILLTFSVAAREWTGLVGFVLLTGVGAVFCLGAMAGLRARADATAGLRLTPGRIVFDAGVDRLAIDWNDVSRLHVFTVRYGLRRPYPARWHNWLRIEARDAAVAVPDARMTVNPLVAYYTIKFYLENPAERRELAGEPAVRRLGAGHLV